MKRTWVQTVRVWIVFLTTDRYDKPGMIRRPWSLSWLVQAWRDARVLGA